MTIAVEEMMKIVETTEKTRELLTRKPDIERAFLLNFAQWALAVLPEMVAEVRWIQEKHNTTSRMLVEKKTHEEIRKHLDVVEAGRK